MFFDVFQALCIKKGVSCKKAAEDIGLSNSITTKWKKTGATPGGDTLNRIAIYFGVSIDFLLGKEKAPAETGKRSISDDEIKFALFGGDGEITDAMYDEVRNFAAYVKQREANKKKE
jgi:transcriptional regulator with XRE-family HTH domain